MFETEFKFTLPKGYMDMNGVLHREGVMRLANAGDEIIPLKDPRVQQGMISVTRVDTTGDLRYAKIWVSVFGLQNEKDLMRGLMSASSWLRRELAASMNLRYTPELIFELDHSIEYGAHINEIIASLDIPHGEEEEGQE